MKGSIYQSLRSDSDNIRLLKVQPSQSRDAIVEIEIVYASLGDKPEYESLSYAWGDPTITKKVRVIGRTDNGSGPLVATDVPVTVNLESALKHLRYPDKVRTIWCDALCINQSDKAEKNHQIHHMAQIYRTASQVCIWLGPTADESDAAMELVRYYWRDPPPNEEELLNNTKWTKAWKALAYMITSREYFKRRWVIQELVVSRASTVYCGTQSGTWKGLYTASRALKRIYRQCRIRREESQLQLLKHSVKSYLPGAAPDFSFVVNDRNLKGDISSAFSRLENLNKISDITRGGNFIPLQKLLLAVSPSKVTNLRDTVYALLSIAEETQHESRKLSIDYFQDTQTTFEDTVEFLAKANKSLDIITSSTGIGIGTCQHVPSWVPTFESGCFRCEPINVLPLRINYNNSKPTYSASAATEPVVSFDRQLHRMTAKGILLDVVQESLKLVPCSDIISVPPEWKKRALAQSTLCVDGGNSNTATFEFNYKKRVEIFWRTLVSDRQWTSRKLSRPSPEWNDIGQKWCEDGMPRHPTFCFKPKVVEDNFHYSLFRSIRVRRLVVTNQRRLGLASIGAQKGDLVVILLGCSVPIILRRAKNPKYEGCYHYAGEAFIYGIMDGEVIKSQKAGDHELQDFTIV